MLYEDRRAHYTYVIDDKLYDLRDLSEVEKVLTIVPESLFDLYEHSFVRNDLKLLKFLEDYGEGNTYEKIEKKFRDGSRSYYKLWIHKYIGYIRYDSYNYERLHYLKGHYTTDCLEYLDKKYDIVKSYVPIIYAGTPPPNPMPNPDIPTNKIITEPKFNRNRCYYENYSCFTEGNIKKAEEQYKKENGDVDGKFYENFYKNYVSDRQEYFIVINNCPKLFELLMKDKVARESIEKSMKYNSGTSHSDGHYEYFNLLECAIKSNSISMVKLLVEKYGMEINRLAMDSAYDLKRVGIIKFFIEKGANYCPKKYPLIKNLDTLHDHGFLYKFGYLLTDEEIMEEWVSWINSG
jgi:hypothetical protein